MKKLLPIFIILAILTGCTSTTVDTEYSSLYQGVNDIPSKKGEFFTSLYTLAEDSSFILTSLIEKERAEVESFEDEVFSQTVDSDETLTPIEDAYEILEDMAEEELPSMCSPLYQGGLGRYFKDEGVGTFWEHISLYSEDDEPRFINAVCVKESENAFYYVEEGKEADSRMVDLIATIFDELSAPTVRSIFGTESDVDGNGKVRFLIADLHDDETMGYYYPLDQYDNQSLEKMGIEYTSNESDMLYVNILFMGAEDEESISELNATFAHEFQHMVFHDMRDKSELPYEGARWINEGLAMLTEYYVGLDDSHYDGIITYFSEMEEISLFDEDHVSLYSYALLFFKYIDEVYGTDAIVAITQSDKLGTEAIEDATGEYFDTLYKNFAAAMLLSGREGIDTELQAESLDSNAIYLDYVYSEEGRSAVTLDDIYAQDYVSPYTLIILKWEESPDMVYFLSDEMEGNYAFVAPVALK